MQSGHWAGLGFSSGKVAAEEELSYDRFTACRLLGLLEGTANLLELPPYLSGLPTRIPTCLTLASLFAVATDKYDKPMKYLTWLRLK